MLPMWGSQSPISPANKGLPQIPVAFLGTVRGAPMRGGTMVERGWCSRFRPVSLSETPVLKVRFRATVSVPHDSFHCQRGARIDLLVSSTLVLRCSVVKFVRLSRAMEGLNNTFPRSAQSVKC